MLLQTWRPAMAALGLAVIPLAASSGPLTAARPAQLVRTHPVESLRRPAATAFCSSNGAGGFVGNGYQNTAGGANSGVLDGQLNQACDQLTGIGAGSSNVIYNNGVAGAEESFIAAGDTNFIAQYRSFIGAGAGSTVNAPYAFIGSGATNTVDTAGIYGFLGGGRLNYVNNAYASIDGGYRNTASGAYATVAGGYLNTASGNSSFAGGQQSLAANTGAFVWSDAASGAKQLASTASNQFLVRASGGTRFYSNAALTSGVSLAPGSGTWSSLSDRTMKTAIVPLDDAAVLDKVVALPVSEWSYTSENGVRHVGPMAQDFYAAFKVGEDDRHITTIDEDGVALAAIKGLYERSEQNNAAAQRENSALRDQVTTLQRRLAELAAKVDTLEKR